MCKRFMGSKVLRFGLLPLTITPTDRFDKVLRVLRVLKVLRVLRVAKCADKDLQIM